MKPAAPQPVKLFVGMLFSDDAVLEPACERLCHTFGKIDIESHDFDFAVSDYYEDELGSPIRRRFVALEPLIVPDEIVAAKLTTNTIEEKLMRDGKRRINLDPGYMDFNKVVLASAKPNSQKIYLSRGIYADPTLWYEKGVFLPYPQSFPDFKEGDYTAFFLEMRAAYKRQLKDLAKDNANERNVHADDSATA